MNALDTTAFDEFAYTEKLLQELMDLRYENLVLKIDNRYLKTNVEFYEKFYPMKEQDN
jgi:hypothetical protein